MPASLFPLWSEFFFYPKYSSNNSYIEGGEAVEKISLANSTYRVYPEVYASV